MSRGQANAIGLVPAFDPFDPLKKTYAFPKRFKIEVLEGTGRMVDGVWVKDPDGYEWEVYHFLKDADKMGGRQGDESKNELAACC